MGVLMSRMWTMFFSSEEYKIILLGLDNAGKTTILYRLHLDTFVDSTVPTIGSNVEQVKFRNFKIFMWDIGGQESLRATWNTYYANTKAVILVIDSTDADRLHLARGELEKMMQSDSLSSAGLLVFANKQDVQGAMSAAEISTSLNLTDIRDHPWHIQACSAKTGDGLTEGLNWVVDNVFSSK